MIPASPASPEVRLRMNGKLGIGRALVVDCDGQPVEEALVSNLVTVDAVDLKLVKETVNDVEEDRYFGTV